LNPVPPKGGVVGGPGKLGRLGKRKLEKKKDTKRPGTGNKSPTTHRRMEREKKITMKKVV